MKNLLKGGGFIIALVVILWMRLIGQYNGLVTVDEEVKESWNNVEGQYQRRLDLIPNLVSTVKGYADHEESVFTAVVEARAKATSTTVDVDDIASLQKFQAAQGEVSSALSRLLVTVEAYPELKANENFMALQKQLEWTENRIANARGKYNAVVKKYSTKVRQFPVNLIAGIFGFHAREGFQADAGAEHAPSINFGE